MDRLRALAVFKAVSDHSSFSRAALALDLSPAAVTRTVQELEALLGVRLLQRSTRRLALTAVGEDVLSRAAGLLASFEELATMSSLCATEPSGTVRLGAPALLGPRHLGPALAGFTARHPKVWVDLRLRDGPADGLDEDVDLALCFDRELRPSWIARRLAMSPVAAYAAPCYLARCGEPSRPGDLQRHACLTSEGLRGETPWRFTDDTTGVQEALPVRGSLHSSHPEALLGAAVHGAGIVLLPDFLAADAVAGGGLRRLLPGWQAEPLTVHLVYRSRRHQPLAVRRLIEHLAASFGAGEGAVSAGAEEARPGMAAAALPTAHHYAAPRALVAGSAALALQ